jgi:hypothetical protein
VVREKVQDKLRKLKMKDSNINQYIANFQLLAMDAHVDIDKLTILKIFYHGLPLQLGERCTDQESPSNFISWANVVQRQQKNWIWKQFLHMLEGQVNQ